MNVEKLQDECAKEIENECNHSNITNEAVVLYSTNCPKCIVLEKKLSDAKIKYEIENDVKKMIEKGFMSAPVLEVNGELMDFKNAVDWINIKRSYK